MASRKRTFMREEDVAQFIDNLESDFTTSSESDVSEYDGKYFLTFSEHFLNNLKVAVTLK